MLDNKEQRNRNRKLPELQIYRPGLGLKRKTRKKSDDFVMSNNEYYCNRYRGPEIPKSFQGSLVEELWSFPKMATTSPIPPPQPFREMAITSPPPLYPEMVIASPIPPPPLFQEMATVPAIPPPQPFQGRVVQELSSFPEPRMPSLHNNQLGLHDTGKKRINANIEKNLLDICALEKQLANYFSVNFLNTKKNDFDHCRSKLKVQYENIILTDPDYCEEKNIEQRLWNSVYQQFIESLRESIKVQHHRKEELIQTLLNVLLECSEFYKNLLEKHQEIFGFNLSHLLRVGMFEANNIPKSVLISCQKILIRLGDLALFEEQANGTTRYTRVSKWYSQAQQIVPENGWPYNQLAVVACQAGRKLDSVFYYLRSLATINPFLSARESLLPLFDDATKKFRRITRTRSGSKVSVWSKNQWSTHWVKCQSEFKNVTTDELNKRFVISFLHVHGMLFTGVGMETFLDDVELMLKQFHHLLQCVPAVFSSTRITQLLLMNMCVPHVTLKDMSQNSALQEHALNLILAMVSMIMERCCSMYEEHLSSTEYPRDLINKDLDQLLPAVKVWTQWLSCQGVWWKTPFFQNKEFLIGYEKSVWCCFAKLLTALKKIESTLDKMKGDKPLFLKEDANLVGFVPLLDAFAKPIYAKLSFEQNNSTFCHRIQQILSFGSYLCTVSVLKFDHQKQMYFSVFDGPYDERVSAKVIGSWADQSECICFTQD